MAVVLVASTALAQDATTAISEGATALENRRFRDAVASLETATRLSREAPDAYYLLGAAYWGEDRSYPISADKAIAALRRAVELDPDGAMGQLALEHLATVYLRNERMPEARRAYQQLLARETREQMVMIYLTRIDEIDLDTGRYVPTAENPRNALGEVTGGVGPLRMHTNQYFEKGRHTWDLVKHVNYFTRAIEADPTLFQAYNNLGVALMHLGRCREAVVQFDRAQQMWNTLQPPSVGPYPDPHVWRLRCYIELGDLEKAAVDYEALKTIDEYNFFATLYTIRLAIAAGQAEDAIAPLEQALSEDPDNIEVLQTLGQAYAAVGRIDDAARVLSDALAAIPDGSQFFRHLVAPWTRQLELWQEAGGSRN
ncbi:MAG: hypothetical protein CL476_14075 [Acidobacteria bacterium]|jgi:tetratricopeptide (TPR) repeat protein|nr:hypothetical protein [Acidobacteriota bacterium]